MTGMGGWLCLEGAGTARFQALRERQNRGKWIRLGRLSMPEPPQK
jgi:hypothetical protein